MRNPNPLYTLAVVLLLTGLLPGCAVERKCGLEGCPGDAKTHGSLKTESDTASSRTLQRLTSPGAAPAQSHRTEAREKV